VILYGIVRTKYVEDWGTWKLGMIQVLGFHVQLSQEFGGFRVDNDKIGFLFLLSIL